MSAQRLSAKKTRWLSRQTGLTVVRAWAHGGYTYDFVTPAQNTVGHLHGWYDTKTGQWALEDNPRIGHYDTCREMFDVPPVVVPHAHEDEH